MSSTSDNQDRMLTHGTLTFSHNQNGERTQKSDSSSSPAAVTNYTYDSVGSLIRVDLPSSDYVEYLYDAFDRRSVRKVNGTVSRYYVYQSDLQIAAEYDSSYNLVARYVYASQSHVPDYVVKSGINYRIVTDHLGSVRLVVRADTGAIAQAISYDEFGRVLSDSNPGFQAFGFAGGLYDHQTSLVRFGARDYDPETGRWLSKDPILFAGGDTNLYGYVLNDPLNFIDPSGQTAEDVVRAIAFIRARTPGYVNHSVSYGNIGDHSGMAKPRVTPWGKNSVVLDPKFLGPLDRNMKQLLLNTLYHENLHLQDGFWGSAGMMFSGRFNSRHNWITNEAYNWARNNIDDFMCGK